MILILGGLYGVLVWLIFGKLRILRFNYFNGSIAVGIGVAAIGALLAMLNLCHPMSMNARVYAYTVPIVPQVGGRVIEVPVQPNVPVKAGDVLFKIDPLPYEQKVKVLQASLDGAEAALAQAQVQFERAKTLIESQAISQQDYDVQATGFESANNAVEGLQADLELAQWNLEQSTMRAPGDGMVTQLQLRPGVMAASLPVMVFVYDDRTILASFTPSAASRVKRGDTVELAMQASPGRIIKGTVGDIIPATASGQLTPGGALGKNITASSGRAIEIRIDTEEGLAVAGIPAGSVGTAAIYTDSAKPIAMIRKVLMRLQTFKHYFGIP